MVGRLLEHPVAHLEVLLQHAAHKRVGHHWATLICHCKTDLLRGPDVLMAAEVLLDLILDLRAQLLSSETLLLYLLHLVPYELLVPHQVHDESRLDVKELRNIPVALATLEYSAQDFVQLLTAELLLGPLFAPLKIFTEI